MQQLILDGVVVNDRRIRVGVSCEADEVEYEQFVDEEDPVQLAVFELEARADWRLGHFLGAGLKPWLSDLARSALLEHVKLKENEGNADPCVDVALEYFEAAALLRDGWRPDGWGEAPAPLPKAIARQTRDGATSRRLLGISQIVRWRSM